MGNFQTDQPTNKILTDGKEHFIHQKGLKVLWLLASQPTKTFSSDDILDVIMESGLMIHEKQFVELLAQSNCKKSDVQVVQKNKNENSEFKNKFMNNHFDFL